MTAAPAHKRIVLTGASGGIGAALADALAAPGVELLLCGRDADRLAAAAAIVRAKGAQAQEAAVDVADQHGMEAAIAAFEAAGPIDLVIANAGVNSGLGPGRTPEPPAASRRVMEINVQGVLNTLDPAIPGMLARGAGHVAIISSVSALRPVPDMPAYSASKAAVAAYGTALRGWLKPKGVDVTVIYPGFITTPLSQRHEGWKPFEVPAARAADVIAKRLGERRAVIQYPLPLALLARAGMLLPPALSDWFMRGFAAQIEPDPRIDEKARK